MTESISLAELKRSAYLHARRMTIFADELAEGTKRNQLDLDIYRAQVRQLDDGNENLRNQLSDEKNANAQLKRQLAENATTMANLQHEARGAAMNPILIDTVTLGCNGLVISGTQERLVTLRHVLADVLNHPQCDESMRSCADGGKFQVRMVPDVSTPAHITIVHDDHS